MNPKGSAESSKDAVYSKGSAESRDKSPEGTAEGSNDTAESSTEAVYSKASAEGLGSFVHSGRAGHRSWL